jgi:hypothetical protein
MLELYAHSFCRASGLIGQFHQQVNCGVFPQAASFDALGCEIHDLEIQCTALGLSNTLAQIQRVKGMFDKDSPIKFDIKRFTDQTTEIFTRLARFIREGAQSGLWGDQITPNIMAWG